MATTAWPTTAAPVAAQRILHHRLRRAAPRRAKPRPVGCRVPPLRADGRAVGLQRQRAVVGLRRVGRDRDGGQPSVEGEQELAQPAARAWEARPGAVQCAARWWGRQRRTDDELPIGSLLAKAADEVRHAHPQPLGRQPAEGPSRLARDECAHVERVLDDKGRLEEHEQQRARARRYSQRLGGAEGLEQVEDDT